MTLKSCFTLSVIMSAATVAGAEPAAPDAAGLAFFEANIRPVLVKNCYECHSEEAGAAEGGLQVDTREALLRGGERGPAVTPGAPTKSWLLTALTHADPDLRMPPRQARLSDTVQQNFRRWIELGAPDPRVGNAASERIRSVTDAKVFWAYQPVTPPTAPTVSDTTWPASRTDHFILSKLEQHGLTPTQDADSLTLVRRLHFDLTGLPPSPQAIDQFVSKVAESGIAAALADEADRLLASPQFGERWGRHWLDVARFAESSGKEANIAFPYAFRYRDYVIDAVTRDVPINRFLQEQLAGDLLPYDSPLERSRLLIATGFLAVGAKNLEEMDAGQFQADVVDEQIDTVTRAVLGASIACARCHDHKFDPFSMRDYYALAGIFGSSKTYFGTFASPANRVGGDPLRLPDDCGQPVFHASTSPEHVKKLEVERDQLTQQNEALQAAFFKAALEGVDPPENATLGEALRIFWTLGRVKGQLDKFDADGRALPLAMGVLDEESPSDAKLLLRGDLKEPRDTIPRGIPSVIPVSFDSAIPADQSGRLQFAEWITSPTHPLTGRVFVNRVWKHLFGAGLVRTVDDFGSTGEAPSHPELLDDLASQFVNEGWSLKRLVRQLVLTRAYRQASTYRADAFQADPDNRWLWRMSKRRLEAEAIRDAMLAASGELKLAPPSGSLVATVIGDGPISLIGLNKAVPKDLDGSLHRSVYLPVIRDRLPDVLDVFDFAEPSLVTGQRETTNVPVQALYLMNSGFVWQRAEAMASRLVAESDCTEERIERAFLLTLGRRPDPFELEQATAFLKGAAAEPKSDGDADAEFNLRSFCQALLSTAEFRHLD